MDLKRYHEKLAQLTLPIVEFNGNFIISDKPDLQDVENNIGIEVTSVESKEEGVFRALLVKHANQELTSNEFINLLKNPHFKQKVIPNNSRIVARVKSSDINILIRQVFCSVCIKADKFENYKNFYLNGLYLFDIVHFLPEHIQFIYDVLKNTTFPFDFYILNIGDKIYYMDKKCLKEYYIKEQVTRLQNLACEYAKNKK